MRKLLLLTTALFMLVACSENSSGEGSSINRYRKALIGTWENDNGNVRTFRAGGKCDYSYVSPDGKYSSSSSGTWLITEVDDKALLTTSMSSSGYNVSIIIVSIESDVFNGLNTNNLKQVTWYKK